MERLFTIPAAAVAMGCMQPTPENYIIVSPMDCIEGQADIAIQAAIDSVFAMGGGTVHIDAGYYRTSATIQLPCSDHMPVDLQWFAAVNVGVTLEGEGPEATTIEKNFDGYAISSIGTSGNERTHIGIKNLRATRNAADTNDNALIYWQYVDNSFIENVELVDAYYHGFYQDNSDNNKFTGITVRQFGATTSDIGGIPLTVYGIASITCAEAEFVNILIDGESVSKPSRLQGFLIATTGSALLTNIAIKNLTAAYWAIGAHISGVDGVIASNFIVTDCSTPLIDGEALGFIIAGDKHTFTGIVVSNIDNTTTAGFSTGLNITGDGIVCSQVTVAGCSGTGILISASADKTQMTGVRTTGNGTNFTDSGTNTTAIIEDS